MSKTLKIPSAKTQLLEILRNLPRILPQWVTEDSFRCVGLYWKEHEFDSELLEAVARMASVPLTVARLYVAYPPVSQFERWRRREPLKIKKALATIESEELREWLIALAVFHTIDKCEGTVGHSLLLRKLDHQVETQEIKRSLCLLRDAKLIESFDEPGKGFRPILYHRITSFVTHKPSDELEPHHVVSN